MIEKWLKFVYSSVQLWSYHVINMVVKSILLLLLLMTIYTFPSFRRPEALKHIICNYITVFHLAGCLSRTGSYALLMWTVGCAAYWMHASEWQLHWQFSGNSTQKDRREHCKTPSWRCWFGGSQPSSWRWIFSGCNNTRFYHLADWLWCTNTGQFLWLTDTH